MLHRTLQYVAKCFYENMSHVMLLYSILCAPFCNYWRLLDNKEDILSHLHYRGIARFIFVRRLRENESCTL